MGIRNEFSYRLGRFDRLNDKLHFSHTAEIVGAIVAGSAGLEQLTRGNLITGLAELAGCAALAGASRSDVRIMAEDYKFDHTRLR